MSAPAIATPVSGSNASASTSHSVTLPASITSGELLLIAFQNYDDSITATLSGWTTVEERTLVISGTTFRWTLFSLEATGGETSVSVTTSSATTSAHVACRITEGVLGPATTDAAGSSDSPDPPDFAIPASYTDDCYVLAVAAWLGDRSASAYPSGYATGQATSRVTGGSGHGLAIAFKLNDGTDNAPAFTLSGSADWIAFSHVINYQAAPAGPDGSFTAETRASAVFGSATLPRAVDVSVLACCTPAAAAVPAGVFGSASWWAAPRSVTPARPADGLSRYYPLSVNDRDFEIARDGDPTATPAIPPDPIAAAAILATGRDIANGHDGYAAGELFEGDDGKLCEDPEQFRLSRFYEIPIGIAHDVQPPAPLPPRLQLNYHEGFTLTMWYRWQTIRQEQTLFSLDPAFRLGVNWLGELSLYAMLDSRAIVDEWTTQRLVSGTWSHIALRFSPRLAIADVLLNGETAAAIALQKPLARVLGGYIGHWDGGSLMNGDAQDVRIYDEYRSTEFIIAERDSYCANWIEVIGA